MTKQQTIESVARNITNLEQLYLNAPSSMTQGIIDAIEGLTIIDVQLTGA